MSHEHGHARVVLTQRKVSPLDTSRYVNLHEVGEPWGSDTNIDV